MKNLTNLLLDIGNLTRPLGENSFYNGLSNEDRTEVIQQAVDVVTEKNYDIHSSSVYLVIDLLKQKPSGQQCPDVNTLFNFLCKELKELFLEYVPCKDKETHQVISFVLINNLIIVKFKEVF